MRSGFSLATALAGVFAVSSYASAAERLFVQEPGAALLAAADNNLDGTLDAAEQELFLNRHFALSDQNGDGKIDAAERDAFTFQWGCGCQDGALVGWKPNADDAVTKDEHFRTGQQAFRTWDGDNDGVLATGEIQDGLLMR